AYNMTTTREFYMLAILVGFVQGGTQALSRSLFARLVPKHKSGEFFGFYSVFEKFGGILGPLLFAIALGQSGSSRIAILSIVAFFIVGGAILAMVNVKAGEEAARASDARTVAAA
ncbi:MAG: MFS transporter, partial [Gemmatimonadaceae bacterium]